MIIGSDPIPYQLRDYHVVPDGNLWAVKAEYNSDYSALFDTQMEAMAYGRHLAKEAASSLIIHGQDGRFRDVWSYR